MFQPKFIIVTEDKSINGSVFEYEDEQAAMIAFRKFEQIGIKIRLYMEIPTKQIFEP